MVVRKISGTVVEADISGQRVRFFVHNQQDWIQRHHFNGEFYETDDLALIAKHVTPDTFYVDIGANVGNHCIWLHKFAGLRHIVPIEPNPIAIAILETNLRLNGMYDLVDRSCLGVGLADRRGAARLMIPQNNLGGARFDQAVGEGLQLVTGDELLHDKKVDFIKIDVEGMEMQCLGGLRRTIEARRPTIFIEVDNQNAEAFAEWRDTVGYEVVARHRRYTSNENFLIKPEN